MLSPREQVLYETLQAILFVSLSGLGMYATRYGMEWVKWKVLELAFLLFPFDLAKDPDVVGRLCDLFEVRVLRVRCDGSLARWISKPH